MQSGRCLEPTSETVAAIYRGDLLWFCPPQSGECRTLPECWQSTLMSVAAMALPISVPFRGKAIADHRAGYVARAGRRTEGSGPIATSAARRSAAHRRTAHRYMAGGPNAAALAQQGHQMIARRDRVSRRAGMPRAAASVHLPRCDARQPDMRPLRAPDRPVAVPHRRWGAVKGLTGGNNGSGKQKRKDHAGVIPSGQGSSTPNFSVRYDGT